MSSTSDLNQACRLPFATIGKDVIVYSRAVVLGAERISLGDSIIIDDFAFISGGEEMRFGSFIHIAQHASLVGGGRLILEDFAGISAGVRLYTGNDDYLGGSLTGPTVPAPYRVPVRSFVHVGRHCVIGANSVVLPGVTMGEGAVVGACSLVKNDLPPWTVNVGTPTRVVGKRPSAKILELEAQLREELYDAGGNYVGRPPAGTS